MMSNDQIQKFQQTQREIEERTLKSTQDSLRLLAETEKCGFATAEALVEQGDQLEKIDLQLDEINGLLVESQKNINGIKSMFGGLKKRLFGKKDKTDAGSVQTTKEIKGQVAKSGLKENLQSYNSPQKGTFPTSQKPVSEPQGTDFNSQFSANMNGMSNSLSMLKGLATGMGEEIDKQEKVIARIGDKVEGADIAIGEQNKQMRKIVKK